MIALIDGIGAFISELVDRTTRREVIFSVLIASIIIAIGMAGSNKIEQINSDRNEKYDSAMQISDGTDFKYCMDTSVGNAFVKGGFKAIDKVTVTKDDGEVIYASYIKEKTQAYTPHTQYHKTKTGGYTTTNWTWDTITTDISQSKQIELLDQTFESSKFELSDLEENSYTTPKYNNTSVSIRTLRKVYYTVPDSFDGIIFTKLMSSDISDSNEIRQEETFKEAIENMENSNNKIIFWIFWSLLTVAAVVAFYWVDNDWLNKN